MNLFIASSVLLSMLSFGCSTKSSSKDNHEPNRISDEKRDPQKKDSEETKAKLPITTESEASKDETKEKPVAGEGVPLEASEEDSFKISLEYLNMKILEPNEVWTGALKGECKFNIRLAPTMTTRLTALMDTCDNVSLMENAALTYFPWAPFDRASLNSSVGYSNTLIDNCSRPLVTRAFFDKYFEETMECQAEAHGRNEMLTKLKKTYVTCFKTASDLVAKRLVRVNMMALIDKGSPYDGQSLSAMTQNSSGTESEFASELMNLIPAKYLGETESLESRATCSMAINDTINNLPPRLTPKGAYP